MVLPENLLQQYEKYCNFSHSTVSRFEQQRLANFMQQGEFERHIHLNAYQFIGENGATL